MSEIASAAAELMRTRPWLERFRYYPFGQFLRNTLGRKAHKISIDGGFTCPNRDGTVSVGGCAYCVNTSFSPAARRGASPIREQVADGMALMRRRYGAERFIAYFQPFTNTFADVDTLRQRYDEAMEPEDVVGLSVGTRPDCVPDEVLDLIEEYAKRYHVWIEYGLQTIHDRTLAAVNRGHDFAAFEDAVRRTEGRGIFICVHVILGLPDESHAQMMQTAETVARLRVDGIKLHHLYIAKGAPMAKDYAEGRITVMDLPDYAALAADVLERLPPDMAIQRLAGEAGADTLIAPQWGKSKSEIMSAIVGELEMRGACQGCRWWMTKNGRDLDLLDR